MNLTKDDKRVMLIIARRAVENNLGIGEPIKIDTFNFPILKERCGAFVTLTKNRQLRGCIGYILSNDFLYETIHDAAIQASSRDPRFSPVKKNELKDIKLEISLLSVPFKMNSYDDIIVGTHGLIVSENGRRGLLLPQVPIEHNMDKDEYLSSLCLKAGLSPNLWKEKVLNIEMFTATVFNEEELGI